MNAIFSNISFFGDLTRLLLQGRTKEARIKALRKHLNLMKRFYNRRSHQGVNIINEVWDYLIILDACRYDDFARLNWLEGRLEKRISRGTNSNEWLVKNFTGYYSDTVYISANPHCSDHLVGGFRGVDHFHKVEHVWKYGWDDAVDTVPPHQVTEAALKAVRQYPDKRMIIHYIQPHGPWIGKTQIFQQASGEGISATGNSQWTGQHQIWRMVREGSVDLNLLRQATLDNLELALKDVEKLLPALSGKIVISADHGEAFGEKWVYAHPAGVYIKELVEVPWFVIDKGERSYQPLTEEDRLEAKAEETSMTVEDEAEIEERLKALGYLE